LPLPANRRPLHHDIAQKISDKIVSGDFEEASLLPPERALCAAFGVSRTVIREAIKSLEIRGLVRIEHGRGTIVEPASNLQVRDSLKLLMLRKQHSIEQLLEIRGILELAMARLAAARRTQDDLQRMQAALDVMRQKPRAPEGYVDADVEFHTQIARAAHNPVLLLILAPIADLMRESRIQTYAGTRKVKRTIAWHERILRRIEARDGDGATEAMQHHLAVVAKDLAARTKRRVKPGTRSLSAKP
jgi:GntR family transcriptional repressor for pyruvate dehydrogenase complex